MQRKLLIGIAALALALPVAAETRTYDVEGFNGIDVSAGINVIFEAGPNQSIVAETERGDLDKLIIEVEDDMLYIKRRQRSGWNWGSNRRDRFTVTVSGPAISSLEASSGSSATANGFAGDYIEIDVSSGATVHASDVYGSEVEIQTSSGASISAAGTCSRANIDTSSGSTVSAASLECEEVFADASSGSSITAYASEKVVGDASSGASVTVRGGASDVTKDKSSGGSVTVS